MKAAVVDQTKKGAKSNLLKYCPFIFGSGLLIGFLLSEFRVEMYPKADNSFKEIRLSEQYKFINPLLECNDTIGSSKFPSDIKHKVESYISGQKSTGNITNASVYYRDLNNGPWFGINEHVLFTPASLIKVPLMISYYKKAEKDPSILTQKLKVSPNVNPPVEETYVKPKITLEVGKEYTIQELIEHMIIYSDNTAYKMLKDNLSKYEFNITFSDFGINLLAIENSKDENVLSIIDYSSFFRILYNSSYLKRDYSEMALQLLSKTDFKEGISAGLPPEVVISHKFGERYYDQSSEKQLHDCGIVYKVSNPYLICVMTRGMDFSKLTLALKDISYIIYSNLDK